MPPQSPAPLPRKVEVDLSGILIRPEQMRPSGFAYEAQLPVAASAEFKDWSISKYLPRLGPSGFANLIFAVGSCVLGLLCTLSIVDNLEHFRRIAHLPGDPIYRRRESGATPSQRFVSKTPPAAAVSRQSGESNGGLLQGEIASSDKSPTPSTLPLMGQNRYFPLLANNDRLFDNLPNNLSSSGSAHEGGGSGGSGEGNGDGNGNGNGKPHVTSEQSRIGNPSQRAPKSILASQTKTSGNRQGLWTSLSGGLGVTHSDKSPPRITRSAGGSIKTGGHNSHPPAATTQSVSARNTMSMHSGIGSVAAMQSHATMNRMQMHSGMLAQPPFARGLGGLNGGGLGGGAGGRHSANARR